MRPETLPDFENPPVIEVVLGIQFDRIAQFQTIHAGELWHEFKQEFSRVQEHPSLTPNFETFGTNRPATNLAVELVSGSPPLPRLWFVNSTQTQLVQFQPDRFIHNWRKVKEQDTYPRYEAIKAKFIQELETLRKFFRKQGLGDLHPNQCEVTYVNHIISEEGENLCEQPETVFRFFRREFDPEILNRYEGSRFQMRFVLSDENNNPIGRLHIDAQPASSADGHPLFVLTLTARGRPASSTLESSSDFLDLGRDKIVRGFAELTTEAMHQRWGRKK